MNRRLLLLPLLLAATVAAPPAGYAQLRPYDPFRWEIFDRESPVLLEAGVSVLPQQRAALAGTEGTLLGLGDLLLAARTGRVALEASGTVRRVLLNETPFAAPAPGVHPPDGARRSDSGDYRVITTVRLLQAGAQMADVALRFGTRLPTTDNGVGLERDRIDFFAALLGRRAFGALRGAAELGVGIHGTRLETYEQSDVLTYALSLEAPRLPLRPALAVVGHADGLAGRAVRGNEELAELRLSVQTKGRVWVRVQAIRGLTEYSPGLGATAAIGYAP